MRALEPTLIYEFGEFRLDAGRRALAHREAGRVQIAPRAFEALCFLVAHRGKLIEKSILMAAVWPSVVVTDNSLSQCIVAVRRALGEPAGESRFVATVPGRGYQFIAAVHAREREQASDVAGVYHSPVPASAVATVAVLPFANLTGDSDKDYVADGIAEELIHTLARRAEFRVAARTSSFAYKDRKLDARQIASDLNVTTIIEGSIRGAGERSRVTVQLIDGRTGYHVWSKTCDRPFTDLFELQDEIADAVVLACTRPARDTPASPQPRPARPTEDPQAYDLLLQAQSLFTRPNPQNLERASQLFAKTIARDADCARAYLGLAHAQHLRLVFNSAAPDSLVHCERNARTALSLDPLLAQGHALLGAVNAHRGQWLEAELHFNRGLEIERRDPQIVLPYVMNLLVTPGYLRQALAALREALGFAPSLNGLPASLSMVSTLLGLDAEARTYADLAMTLGWHRGLAPLADSVSQLAVRAQRFGEASDAILEGLPAAITAVNGRVRIRLVFEALGNPALRGAAVSALRALESSVAPGDLDRTMRHRFMLWYVQLGALDAAFETADRLLDHYTEFGTIGTLWTVLWMPEMSTFRSDARFSSLCERLGLPAYWAVHGVPDAFHTWPRVPAPISQRAAPRY